MHRTMPSIELLLPTVARFAGFLLCLPWSAAAGEDEFVTPWSRGAFVPEEGCQWQPAGFGAVDLPRNGHYLAGPRPGQDWQAWLAKLRAYRQAVRARSPEPGQDEIAMRFAGVRAWVRVDRRWAWAADLAPGETVRLRGEARWMEGNSTLCLALDWCDRGRGADGPWKGWSTVLASTPIAQDSAWHRFELAAKVPPFDAARLWARPILGMDGTFDRRPGSLALRNLTLSVPKTPARANRRPMDFDPGHSRVRAGIDDAVYRRPDLVWMTRNFVCGFVMVHDRSFWDPERREYRAGPLCDEAQREFGGFDSVVLWHAYPRIGADPRNQFDFFRDMPGGLPGVRQVVREFQQRGVKVFVPYNPWDTGTRREPCPDDQALASLVATIEADGIFLDTMVAAPAGLRRAVDGARPGVAFEPEGHPAIEELSVCSGSWAQWLQEYPEIGVLHLKWLEPRHMQHQIRRWDSSHRRELAAAWLNGSGVLVWENVFGSWNPWNAEDRAALRRMAPVLRHFAPLLAQDHWLPYFPTQVDKVYASCWENETFRLWTLVNLSGRKADGAVIEVEDQGASFWNLWSGERIEPQRSDGKVRVPLSLDGFGAIAAVKQARSRSRSGDKALPPGAAVEVAVESDSRTLASLLEGQRREAGRTVPRPEDDPHVVARSVVDPLPPPPCPAADPKNTAGMIAMRPASTTFVVKHMRRECGCYPDPGTPPAQWDRFLRGSPHDGTLEHRVRATLGPYWIDPRPVTNGQFEAFLKATGYQPRCPDKFLHHWGGAACPADLRDKPVVYVDLDDSRAYAAWAGKRLPTEWEWQHAAEHSERQPLGFQHSEVFEWTESQRDDGHTRFVMLRGGSAYQAKGSIWYFPGGPQPIASHAKFLLMAPGLDRCATIGFRCVAIP